MTTVEQTPMRPAPRSMLARLLRRRDDLAPPAATRTPPGDDLAALLGRPAVDLRTPELQRFLTGRRVLVTGAGGSIGSEICRQAMRFHPQRLVLLERSEPALFSIEQELQSRWLGSDVTAVLADVIDAARLDRVFAEERPDVVVHAAAHKHVPMMERHPGEAVKNNALGTALVADAARRHGARSFVLVSTDKAVNPTSVMGATKRVAEMVVVSGQGAGGRGQGGGGRRSRIAPSLPPATCHPPPRYSAVRFGNVLGSSGSVVPTFARQIAAGGPVTVTHPAMRRYFMTIPEAASLVLQAGAIGRGGEVFVLDMGEPVSILSLAEAMIRRAGLVPGVDVPIRFTGVRPGEKLEEELGDGAEATGPMLATGHPKIRVWPLPPADPRHVARSLDRLRAVVDAPADDVVDALRDAVPEYRPNREARPADRDAARRRRRPRDRGVTERRATRQAGRTRLTLGREVTDAREPFRPDLKHAQAGRVRPA